MADDKKKNPEKKTGAIPKLFQIVLGSSAKRDDEITIVNADTSESHDDERPETKKETGAIPKQLREEPMPSTSAQFSASTSIDDELLQKPTNDGSFRKTWTRRSIKTLRLLNIIPPEPKDVIKNLVNDEIELFGSRPNSPPESDTTEPTLSSIDTDMKLLSFDSLEMLSVSLSDRLPEPLPEQLSGPPSGSLLETMSDSLFEPIELPGPDYVEANKLPVYKFKAKVEINEEEYKDLTMVKFNHSGPLNEPSLSYLAVICKNRIKIYDVPVKDSKFKIRLDHKEEKNEYITCDWSYINVTDGDSIDEVRAPRLAVGGNSDNGGVVTILYVKGANFYKESAWLLFKEQVNQVLFHVKDNNLLFIANGDCISLWNIEKRKCVCIISNPRTKSIDINSAGTYLAAAADNEIKVWNVDLGDVFMRTQIKRAFDSEPSPMRELYVPIEPICIQNKHNYLVDSVKWYLNTIISKDINGVLLFWQINDLGLNTDNYTIIMKIEVNNCPYETNLDAIYNERTNRYLAVGGNSVINVWDLNSKVFDRLIKYEIVLPDCNQPISSTTISTCGNVLVAAATDGTLYCWNHRHRYIFNLYNY